MRKKLKVRRIIDGRVLEREITNLSRITSNEAKTMIGITLRHLYTLVQLGKVHPIKKGNRLFFKYGDIEKFLTERR